MPDFGRAFYVYNHLVRSCIYLNPQVVISRFNNWKKLFVKKENFLLQAEKYIKENGTEALEQLIADKNANHCLKAQAINAVLAADQKEMQQHAAYLQKQYKQFRLQREKKCSNATDKWKRATFRAEKHQRFGGDLEKGSSCRQECIVAKIEALGFLAIWTVILVLALLIDY